MLTYESASKLLGNRADKKLARNTYLRMEEGKAVVKFWDTDIITITPDNVYTLTSGGYNTFTTKDRLNTFSPVHIWREKGLWYACEGPGGNPIKTLFEDGMQVDANGHVLSEVGCPDLPKYMRKVDRLVAKYIKGYIASIMEAGELPEDTSGDCWFCLMKSVDHPENKELMGYDHYLSHFADKYYVPSILLKGMNEVPYGDRGFVWSIMKANVGQGREPYQLRYTLGRFFRTRKVGIAKELARQAA